ncbi:MAG: HIT domain-containing protein [Nanoarchaeota archaeon]|nr:HIT domain-containing protein [Nanoarchaeota archaeon]MBU1269789.1 HIT domain-containing protein [Nanoarchaeota archaeon]MBU1604381.1 HIT domain-containing protein [Nanoarchaeota archaeon]MBU2443762.1 HIT domain-containing protein [Nanoarchaeota archaeon]
MSDSEPTEEEQQNMSPEQVAELQKKNCVFCKIMAGEVPSHKVYEDDKMMAILDIYPAVKGHILVMPKKHTQIMPLIPQETLSHIFKNVKYLSRGVKQGVPSTKTTIFIANGGVAGQQSPHFLFHIIPRDNGDGLDNFNPPTKNISQDELLEPLKSSLTKMMQSQLQQEGKVLAQPPNKDDLAKIIDQNPQLKEAIINNPEQVKKEMETNQKLKLLFQGVNIDKLSDILKQIETAKKTLAEQEESTKKEEEAPKQTLPDKKKENKNLLDNITNMFTK